MKYTVVKQFSNFAIDNAYSFIFKIVDFGKILKELFWGFVEIWSAFFGIFYNFFMYIYYLFLFMIDRGSESTSTTIIGLKKSQKVSKIPSVSYERTPSPVASMSKKKAVPAYEPTKPATVSAAPKTIAAPTVAKTTEPIKSASSATLQTPSTLAPLKMSSPGKGAKKSFFKTIAEFIAEYLGTVKNIIVKPFKFIIGLFAKKLQPVKESDAKAKTMDPSKGGSLIDQYMKEYEKKKR